LNRAWRRGRLYRRAARRWGRVDRPAAWRSGDLRRRDAMACDRGGDAKASSCGQ